MNDERLGELVGARTAVVVPGFLGTTAVRGHWQWSRYTLLDRSMVVMRLCARSAPEAPAPAK